MSGSVVLESMFNAVAETIRRDNGGDQAFLTEMMDGLRYMMQREDQGWTALFGGADEVDPLAVDLEMLKAWEKEISELTLGSAWLKRGLSLRHGYVWSGGIRYGEIPEGGRQGVRDVKKYVDDSDNQRNFFEKEARRRREARLYYSGIALYLGNDKTKKITPLPLRQITDQILAPDGTGEVWAYKREWSERDLATGKVVDKKSWIFTHRAIGNRVKSIKEDDGEVPVSQTERIFDLHANRLEGMAYGTPDALAAAAWHKIVKGSYLDGVQMTAALASFAFQVTSKKDKGAQKASLELASPLPAGSTAVVGQNDLQSIASAGKAYEFSKLTSLLAIVATALDVSVIHLSSAPADAGSSYSAAENLDLPSKLTMASRRDLHIDFDKQVLSWMGAPNPEVAFAPYESGTETYRAVQALILAAQAGAYSVAELRNMIDDLLALPNGKPPKGALEFNNIESEKARAKVAVTKTPSTDGSNSSVASPAQGRGNGTDGQSGGNASNDLR